MTKANLILLQGDARYLPVQQYDSIVTDPPYGRSSSTRGAIASQLIRSVLTNSIETITPHGSLCICGSTELELSELVGNIGVEIEHRILIPVHSGLTREIVSGRF